MKNKDTFKKLFDQKLLAFIIISANLILFIALIFFSLLNSVYDLNTFAFHSGVVFCLFYVELLLISMIFLDAFINYCLFKNKNNFTLLTSVLGLIAFMTAFLMIDSINSFISIIELGGIIDFSSIHQMYSVLPLFDNIVILTLVMVLCLYKAISYLSSQKSLKAVKCLGFLKKNKRKVIIVSTCLIVIIGALGVYSYKKSVTLDPFEGCEMIYSGYNGGGSAEIECDIASFKDQRMIFVLANANYTIENSHRKLKNGDIVNVIVHLNEDLVKYYGYKYFDNKKSFKVEGLKEVYLDHSELPEGTLADFKTIALEVLDDRLDNIDGITFIGNYFKFVESGPFSNVVYVYKTAANEYYRIGFIDLSPDKEIINSKDDDMIRFNKITLDYAKRSDEAIDEYFISQGYVKVVE